MTSLIIASMIAAATQSSKWDWIDPKIQVDRFVQNMDSNIPSAISGEELLNIDKEGQVVRRDKVDDLRNLVLLGQNGIKFFRPVQLKGETNLVISGPFEFFYNNGYIVDQGQITVRTSFGVLLLTSISKMWAVGVNSNYNRVGAISYFGEYELSLNVFKNRGEPGDYAGFEAEVEDQKIETKPSNSKYVIRAGQNALCFLGETHIAVIATSRDEATSQIMNSKMLDFRSIDLRTGSSFKKATAHLLVIDIKKAKAFPIAAYSDVADGETREFSPMNMTSMGDYLYIQLEKRVHRVANSEVLRLAVENGMDPK